MSTHLIAPHGGNLINLIADDDRCLALKKSMRDVPSWTLSERQNCDIELLINGAFSPLTGFMGRADYESVCDTMSLVDGTFWPIPITLDVPEDLAGRLSAGKDLALRDQEGVLIAVLHVDDIYRPDKRREAESVYGTQNPEHPGVAFLFDKTHPVCLGGRIEAIETPEHFDFQALRLGKVIDVVDQLVEFIDPRN